MRSRSEHIGIIMTRLRLDRLPRRVRKLLLALFVTAGVAVTAFVVFDQWVFPFPSELLHRPNSVFVYSSEGRLLTAFTSRDRFWRKPVKLDEISPKLIKSVIVTEDRHFYWHPGVNPVSLVKAAIANIRAGHTVRGGSTITMQIARMIEPKDRTVTNKLFEIFRALQLELRYSKSELLEVYFNLAPYGGNIEGIGAATHFYFNKKPSELTWSEAALLTAIPGSPEKFRPDKCLQCGTKRSAVILERLKEAGVISSNDYAAALTEEIPSQRLSVPRMVPHLAVSLSESYPDSSELHTTIKYAAQQTCEQIASAYHRVYENKDIHNLAIVVIDNRKAEVIAEVGSPDFDDSRHSGQVDAANAPRSPGSALKPFVYALAFDDGVLSPEMKVPDIPVNYSGYQPVNYDETYRGIVSVREALVRSLNVPAVNAASEVGLSDLYDVLKRGGLSTLDRPYYTYGLPLILGAAEVRLIELTNLYAALAREGVYKPAKVFRSARDGREVRLFSTSACYILSDILVDLQRPDLPDSWRSARDRFPIAWKTGTSYGRRDAWAVGYTPQYTVGVWAGNCTGEGSVDIVGASISGPVMFDVMSQLTTNRHQPWYEQPPDVSVRKVCGVSGCPAGRFCDETVDEMFIVGKSPSATCKVHRPIFVDTRTGARLRASCLAGRDYTQRTVEVWPPQLAAWLVNSGLSAPLPPYDTVCMAIADERDPVIISPENDAVFVLVDDIQPEYQKIRLEASVPSGDGTVHWFLDGNHYAAAQASDVLFYVPSKGRHTLLCVDASGHSASTKFVVN